MVVASALIAVLLTAIIVRGVVLQQVRTMGFFDRPMSDARIYVERSKGIADGDWIGPEDFVHAPLYAYVLGIARLLGATEPIAIRWVQIGLSLGTCLLVFVAGRRFFCTKVGLIGAGLLAIYPPAIFFDLLVQKAWLEALLGIAFLAVMDQAARNCHVGKSLLAGCLLGLLALTRQNALAVIPLVPLWIWLASSSNSAARRTSAVAIVMLAIGITLAPWALRNRVVLGHFTLSTPNLGQNFEMGNRPDATGSYFPTQYGTSNAEHEQEQWVREVSRSLGRPASAQEVSDYYFARGLAFMRNQPSSWLKLTGKKVLMMWNSYEAPDTEDYYLYREYSPVLRRLDSLFHFGVLAPLAMVGLMLSLSCWRSLWPLYAWFVVMTLAVAVFVIFARYRAVMIPPLCLFAAAGLTEVAGLLRKRRWRPLVRAVTIGVAAAIVTNWTILSPRKTNATAYANHASCLLELGRSEEAMRELDKATIAAPNNVDSLLVRGDVYYAQGWFEEAGQAYRKAREADTTNSPITLRGMAASLVGLKKFAEADELYHECLKRDPDDQVAMNGLATSLAMQGRMPEALTIFNKLIEAHPRFAEAYVNRGNLMLAQNRLNDAEQDYSKALELRADAADACLNLATVRAMQGRVEDAIALCHRALRIRPDYDEATYNLGVLESRRGRYDAAIDCFRPLLSRRAFKQDAELGMATALIDAHRSAEAKAFIERILAKEPAREDLRKLLGRIDPQP
jgi:tetratricopeptide (TPR) repeat protein